MHGGIVAKPPVMPLVLIVLFWYSPRFGVDLSTKRTDPRGLEVLTVTDINPSQPDPNLLVVPTGAKTVDHRTAAPRR
jgi:hypothetical protein